MSLITIHKKKNRYYDNIHEIKKRKKNPTI